MNPIFEILKLKSESIDVNQTLIIQDRKGNRNYEHNGVLKDYL